MMAIFEKKREIFFLLAAIAKEAFPEGKRTATGIT